MRALVQLLVLSLCVLTTPALAEEEQVDLDSRIASVIEDGKAAIVEIGELCSNYKGQEGHSRLVEGIVDYYKERMSSKENISGVYYEVIFFVRLFAWEYGAGRWLEHVAIKLEDTEVVGLAKLMLEAHPGVFHIDSDNQLIHMPEIARYFGNHPPKAVDSKGSAKLLEIVADRDFNLAMNTLIRGTFFQKGRERIGENEFAYLRAQLELHRAKANLGEDEGKEVASAQEVLAKMVDHQDWEIRWYAAKWIRANEKYGNDQLRDRLKNDDVPIVREAMNKPKGVSVKALKGEELDQTE